MAALTHRHIEVFRALMLSGGTTRAAEMLYTSQPTVSRELARMEQVIGYALFERMHGRLRPTQAALALFDEVRLAYEGLERVTAAAARLGEFRDGRLSVITLPAFSHSILPGACRRFQARYPSAALSVEMQEPPMLEEWLTAQRYDLGLTEHDAPPPGTRLESLLEVDEVCVLPDGHPLLAKRMLALEDLAPYPAVCLSPSDPYRKLIDHAFQTRGIALHPVVETPSAVSVCAFVRQGLGTAIVNPLTALDFVGRNLHIRPLDHAFPFRVSAVLPEHRPKNLLLDGLIDALRAEAHDIEIRLAAQVRTAEK